MGKVRRQRQKFHLSAKKKQNSNETKGDVADNLSVRSIKVYYWHSLIARICSCCFWSDEIQIYYYHVIMI